MEEEIFTREEAASYLKVDKGTITQWIRSGRLQAAKINPDKPKSPLGPQSAKIFCEFHRSIVNRCADEIRKVGVKVSIKGN